MRYRTLKLKQIMGQIIDKYKIHPSQLDINSQDTNGTCRGWRSLHVN